MLRTGWPALLLCAPVLLTACGHRGPARSLSSSAPGVSPPDASPAGAPEAEIRGPGFGSLPELRAVHFPLDSYQLDAQARALEIRRQPKRRPSSTEIRA